MKFQLTLDIEVPAQGADGEMIPTAKHGLRHVSELDMRVGGYDDPNETAAFVEYRLKTTGELVHRSAHTTLKKPGVAAAGEVASLG